MDPISSIDMNNEYDYANIFKNIYLEYVLCHLKIDYRVDNNAFGNI